MFYNRTIWINDLCVLQYVNPDIEEVVVMEHFILSDCKKNLKHSQPATMDLERKIVYVNDDDVLQMAMIDGTHKKIIRQKSDALALAYYGELRV